MKLILTILCFVFSYQLSAQKIQFIRGCNGGPDNNIYWRIYPDSCKLISTVKLFGTESQFVYPFSIIDSSLTASNKQYKHAGANIPSNKPWLYYLEYRVICGIDTMIRYTDTLSIDTVKPEATYLDSVSVDPTTNWVYLGWTSNKSIDFNTYYIYNFDRVNPILTQTHRDTFYVDNGVDPKNKSLTYQITSSDSCDNAKPYDPTPHKTIYLTSIIDTCTNIVNLNWSKYIGWPDVLKYYIFRNINQNGYALLDSTIGSINTFSDKSVSYNSSILYFVRALKGSSSRLITSTSNSIGVLSGKSKNPSQTQIEYVTNNNSDQIEIQIKPNISANYSEIGLYKYVNQSPIKIYTYTGNENLYQDLAAPNTAVNRYFLISKNVCNQNADTSKNSNNIVLQLTENSNIIKLNWNGYFTWNSGVKDYIIYRASAVNISEAKTFKVIKNVLLDTNYVDTIIDNNVVCYYIISNELNLPSKSKSNTVCNIKIGKIFYPNAIVLSGINNHFTFIGQGINLISSSIKIYNRWGILIFEKDNISDGWFGVNMSNQEVEGGVYFFTANINQGEQNTVINGNITVIK